MNRQKHTTTSALLLIAMLALVTGCPNDGGNGGKTNADAALSSLTVTAGTETLALSPAFNPDTTAYTLQVPNSINAIKVTAVARNSKATVDKASQDIALVVGANTVSVTATAQNGTAKTYTITVTRLIGETIEEEAPNISDFGAGATIASTFTVSNATEWENAVTAINAGGNNKNYVINLADDINLSSWGGDSLRLDDVIVSIRGNKTISGLIYSFSVEGKMAVILRDVTLKGLSNNNSTFVIIEDKGTLEMKGTAKITGNEATGSAKTVAVYGTLIMHDSAKISDNTTDEYGVFVSGTFTMKDNASVVNNIGYWSGGVYVWDGIFTMQDNASVSGNTTQGWPGGGVHVYDGIFTMQDNTSVSGNTATNDGGGVYVRDGIFTMQDSTSVSGNTATDSGGGVYASGGIFTMQDNASISGNTADYGGGVYNDNGTFTIQGNADISNNTATNDGGGVYNNYEFYIEGGTIINNNATTNGGGIYNYNSIFGLFAKSSG